jgi:hypothetical protein
MLVFQEPNFPASFIDFTSSTTPGKRCKLMPVEEKNKEKGPKKEEEKKENGRKEEKKEKGFFFYNTHKQMQV